ncbi:proline hydroxylase [Mycolicibacterium mucogenicum]|uniref:Proline hydroxylase n=1 Tax=Mycolicibacterium mucogenicum TaxID=56689 RepID=A0A1A3H8F4_MYCMU|nr:2OG-Fe(II) oxygenase [Mycolicibacterium mucogenicum]OBJ43954.1 proline hydroxylase [Mycolicibacterium mucogenicum]
MSVWQQRVAATDWGAVRTELETVGGALTGPLVTGAEAAELAAIYPDTNRFRSTIDMARYRFGEGQYRYFHRPYPEIVTELKYALYPRLLPIARDWWTRLRRDPPWPDSFDDWLDTCHRAGQTRTTALLLKYGTGGWCALHQDLYGDLVFPLQVVINLTRPEVEYTGGEFLLYEQRPRAQSRGSAISIPFGHGLVITTRERPVASKRGWAVGPVRHGVSTLRSGNRMTLGLIFHDAA